MNELIKIDNGYEMNGVQVISTGLVAKEFGREHKVVVKDIKRYLDNEDMAFEEGKHFYRLDLSEVNRMNLENELQTSNVQQDFFFLTERGFNKLVMRWNGPKADAIREHILDVYFKAKEIHEQGKALDVQSQEMVEVLKATLIQTFEDTNVSRLDMFAPKPGGFYRKEISRLVYKRARDKRKKAPDVWLELYRMYKREEGVDPVLMADRAGVGMIDWVASVGKLNILYNTAVKLCEDRYYDEVQKEVVYDIPDDTPLDEV